MGRRSRAKHDKGHHLPWTTEEERGSKHGGGIFACIAHTHPLPVFWIAAQSLPRADHQGRRDQDYGASWTQSCTGLPRASVVCLDNVCVFSIRRWQRVHSALPTGSAETISGSTSYRMTSKLTPGAAAALPSPRSRRAALSSPPPTRPRSAPLAAASNRGATP